MSGDHNDYHMKVEVLKGDGVYLTSEEMHQMLEALEEAVHFIVPTEEDMQKKAGVYRVVKALEKLKEKNT